jgi:hypothetical protein
MLRYLAIIFALTACNQFDDSKNCTKSKDEESRLFRANEASFANALEDAGLEIFDRSPFEGDHYVNPETKEVFWATKTSENGGVRYQFYDYFVMVVTGATVVKHYDGVFSILDKQPQYSETKKIVYCGHERNVSYWRVMEETALPRNIPLADHAAVVEYNAVEIKISYEPENK